MGNSVVPEQISLDSPLVKTKPTKGNIMFLDLTNKCAIETNIISYLSLETTKGAEIASLYDLFNEARAQWICDNVLDVDGNKQYEVFEVSETVETSDRFGYHKSKLLRYRVSPLPRLNVQFSMTCMNDVNVLERIDTKYEIIRMTAKKIYTSCPSITFTRGRDGYYWNGWKMVQR